MNKTDENRTSQDSEQSITIPTELPETPTKVETVEVIKPPANSLSKRDLYILMSGICLSTWVASMDTTVVAPSLNIIIGDLGGRQEYSWVVISYLLTSTALAPSYGRFSDIFGRRSVYAFALIGFMVGSVICGAAVNMSMLIAARAIQGVGGAGIFGLGNIVIGVTFLQDIAAPRDRGKYVGIIVVVYSLSVIVGPLIGGAFTDHVSWRWIFYFNLPVGVVALGVIWIGLRKIERVVKNSPKIDWIGTLLIVFAVVALLLPLQWGGTQKRLMSFPKEKQQNFFKSYHTRYNWDSAIIISLLIVSCFLFTAFLLAERRHVLPIMPMRLFSNRNISAGTIMGFCSGFCMNALIIYLPVWFQVVKGEDATTSGLQLIPLLLGVSFTAAGAGVLAGKFGHYKPFPIVSFALLGVGFGLLSLMDKTSGQGYFIPFLLICGVGIGPVNQMSILAAQNSVEIKDIGTATATLTFTRTIGGVFGVAYMQILLQQFLLSLSSTYTDMQDLYSHAFARTFLCMLPWAGIGFVASWCLKHVPLRSKK